MKKIAKDIFSAIHEGKWLAIEYQNKTGNTTNYWIGIKGIHTSKQMLIVDGLNVASAQLTELTLFYASIRSTEVIQGSYCPINSNLIADIEKHPSQRRIAKIMRWWMRSIWISLGRTHII